MKKIPFFILTPISILIFIVSSCVLNPLIHEGLVDDKVTHLICNVPKAESYPDADILTILEEEVEEVFEDGRCIYTSHTVFKIINERGKDQANIKIGFNSRTSTACIIYARTITPEGKIIPLKKNAIQVITPFEEYPSYSDYKKLTFSMPGVAIGSVIDYKVVIEERKPIIEGKF